MSPRPGLGWPGIVRLGLVQTALGAVVVLTTSTLNRVMVVELALPATLPGLLVGIHYAIQLMRPRMGYGSDMGGRRTPWILGGIVVLAVGGISAALATAWMATDVVAGMALAALAFLAIGAGVGAAGTSLLALLASEVEERRRPAAATLVWLMMIAGFAVTAGIAGQLLDPFTPARLVAVAAGVSLVAVVVTFLAVLGVERPRVVAPAAAPAALVPFRAALAEIWAERDARRFSIFVFVSMLAYSAADLILEPFAGQVFGLTVGQSTSLAGLQNAGTLIGMVLVAVGGSVIGGRLGSMRLWTIGGCFASAAVLSLLAVAGRFGAAWPLAETYVALGIANGAFAAAAIATMMQLAGRGRATREGTRMGLWGAAQAVAFGLGSLAGTVATDVARWTLGSAGAAYGAVFAAEAVLFVIAAGLAAGIGRAPDGARASPYGAGVREA